MTQNFRGGIKYVFMEKYNSSQKLELHEGQDMKWVKLSDIKKMKIIDHDKEVLEKIKESIAEKKAVSIDVKHLPEFANREWCALTINPIFDEQWNVKYFVGISHDISGRKKTEQEIQEHSEEQSRLVNALIDREIKMTELKRENDELRKSLGFPEN